MGRGEERGEERGERGGIECENGIGGGWVRKWNARGGGRRRRRRRGELKGYEMKKRRRGSVVRMNRYVYI